MRANGKLISGLWCRECQGTGRDGREKSRTLQQAPKMFNFLTLSILKTSADQAAFELEGGPASTNLFTK